MKLNKIILTAAVACAAMASASVFARDVGVSVSVGQPGFFGTVNVGYPVERVVYAQPYVEYAPRVARYEPVYYSPRYERHDRYCAPRHFHGYDGYRDDRRYGDRHERHEWRERDGDWGGRHGYRGGRGGDD